MVTNQSTNDAYISIAVSSAAVAIAASTVASSGNNLIMGRARPQVFSTPPNCFVSAITTGGQADLIVQPGSAGTLG